MKRIIVMLAALVAFSAPVHASKLIAQDKAQHIGACYAAELTIAQMKPFRKWKPWQRILFTTAVIEGLFVLTKDAYADRLD